MVARLLNSDLYTHHHHHHHHHHQQQQQQQQHLQAALDMFIFLI